MSTDSVSHL